MCVRGCGCIRVSVCVHAGFACLNCLVCPRNKSCSASTGLCVPAAPDGELEELPCTTASPLFLLKVSFRNVFVY